MVRKAYKNGRGSFDFIVEVNHNICAVSWYDTRQVILVPSFADSEAEEKIQCWNKANKAYVEDENPYIVSIYNKFMGGVNMLDSFAAKYKFSIEIPLLLHLYLLHTIIVTLIIAWLHFFKVFFYIQVFWG